MTSPITFSAAEEFAYDLQQLKRATIIGEATHGGAHPAEEFILNDSFLLAVPAYTSINPVSQTNWEGLGVKPDIEMSAKKALDKAIELAKSNLK